MILFLLMTNFIFEGVAEFWLVPYLWMNYSASMVILVTIKLSVIILVTIKISYYRHLQRQEYYWPEMARETADLQKGCARCHESLDGWDHYSFGRLGIGDSHIWTSFNTVYSIRIVLMHCKYITKIHSRVFCLNEVSIK